MYRWGRDGGEELCDDGLGWIGGIAITFAGRRRVSLMNLHEFMKRGVQCGMRYSKMGMIWIRDESCVWGDRLFFAKNQALSCQKSRKNKYKYACGLMTETDTHTHASNDSYEHPPR